jgi:hypothetical protein
LIYPLIGLLLGAIIGGFRAKSHGGSAKDIAQWSIAFAIMCGLIGLFILIYIARSYV